MTDTFHVFRHLSRFLLVHYVLLLLGYNSSTMFVTAFTAPTTTAGAIRRRQHRHFTTSSMQPTLPRQAPLLLSCTSPTALNVVTSRSNNNNGASSSSSSSTVNNGAFAEKNGKHTMSTQEEEQEAKRRIPFIIEQLPIKKHKSDYSPLDDRVFAEISEMCINVFFNDNCIAECKPAPIWKEVQLAYLRKLQQGDLKQRRQHNPDTNLMYIAREVVPAANTIASSTHTSTSTSTSQNNAHHHAQQHQSKPLVLDLSQVYNLPSRSGESGHPLQLFNNFMNNNDNNNNNNNDHDDVDYVCGRILGFVEVTQRPYGLGEDDMMMTTTKIINTGAAATATALDQANENHNGVPSSSSSSSSYYYQQVLPAPRRPILTNLSVRYEARGSGVGSCLLQTLEQGVLTQWKGTAGMNNKEIILEVEDDNEKAIQFYQKRGYQPIFQDPASRRYDTNGLILRQMRCNRIIMRKNLINNNNNNKSPSSPVSSSSNGDELAFLVKAFQRLKESVLSF